MALGLLARTRSDRRRRHRRAKRTRLERDRDRRSGYGLRSWIGSFYPSVLQVLDAPNGNPTWPVSSLDLKRFQSNVKRGTGLVLYM